MGSLLTNSVLADGILGMWQIIGLIALIVLIVVYFKIRNRQD